MLHPFFSYFGSKYRLSKLYPVPLYDSIVEPFAGSAGYSLLYPDSKVILYEIYEPIVLLWDYLINVTEKEILGLPLGPFDKDNPIDNENIALEAKILIGFWATESQTSSSRYPLSKSRGGNWTENKKKMLADQLQHIRHWKIKKKSFNEVDDFEATWYIDPPYQKAGKRYKFNKIDYNELSTWCNNRSGQIIVCEQEGADWLDFKSLAHCRNGSNKQYKEVVYSNIDSLNYKQVVEGL